jgi:predicted amidohydrolase YtcJ
MPARVNRMTAFRVTVVACTLLGSLGLPALGAETAQLILIHGRILTLDPSDRIVEALAIRDGKIIAVGTDRDILRLAAPSSRRIDLNGRTATPGLIDSHAHIADAGVADLYHVHLSDVSTVAEAVRRVRAGLAALKPGEWLQGDGWDEGKLAERRYLRAADLDGVSPDNPVWLLHTTGHYGVANSAALRLAKITRDTPNPVAGTIDRDGTGVPTGVLKESAMDAVVDLVPPPTAEQQRAGILKSIDTLHREGITAVKDPSIERPVWDAYRTLLNEGRLTEHVCVLWYAGTSATAPSIGWWTPMRRCSRKPRPAGFATASSTPIFRATMPST